MKWADTLDKTLKCIAGSLFVILLGVVVLQIVLRYLPFSFIWTEELTRYLFVYTIAVAAPLALRRDEFVKVDLFFRILSAKNKKIYESAIHILILIFSIFLLVEGIRFFALGTLFSSPTVGVLMSYIYASVPLLAILLIVYCIISILDRRNGINAEEESS